MHTQVLNGASGAVTVFAADLDALLASEECTTFAGPEDGTVLNSHKVYNFEVAGTHTYIADGIRVHNTSVLSFLSDGEVILDVVISPT